jgi:hypothetical protein
MSEGLCTADHVSLISGMLHSVVCTMGGNVVLILAVQQMFDQHTMCGAYLGGLNVSCLFAFGCTSPSCTAQQHTPHCAYVCHAPPSWGAVIMPPPVSMSVHV